MIIIPVGVFMFDMMMLGGKADMGTVKSDPPWNQHLAHELGCVQGKSLRSVPW